MTHSSHRSICSAQSVAFDCPRAIVYNARNRSRVRTWTDSVANRRKSFVVCFHFATSGRIILIILKIEIRAEGIVRLMYDKNVAETPVFRLNGV